MTFKHYFYEEEHMQPTKNDTSGSQRTAKSTFETIDDVQKYLDYCPYDVDYRIIPNPNGKGYTFKFRKGISKTVEKQLAESKLINKQIKALNKAIQTNPELTAEDDNVLYQLAHDLHFKQKRITEELLFGWSNTKLSSKIQKQFKE